MAGKANVLSSQQRDLIRESFERLRPLQAAAGELFYRQLFALMPETMQLFERTPITAQAGKFMQIVEYAVDRLDHWPAASAQLKEMGARHAGYGVRPDHYANAGVALINTLRATLGPKFSEETEEAWIEFYTNVSLAMEDGARL